MTSNIKLEYLVRMIRRICKKEPKWLRAHRVDERILARRIWEMKYTIHSNGKLKRSLVLAAMQKELTAIKLEEEREQLGQTTGPAVNRSGAMSSDEPRYVPMNVKACIDNLRHTDKWNHVNYVAAHRLLNGIWSDKQALGVWVTMHQSGHAQKVVYDSRDMPLEDSVVEQLLKCAGITPERWDRGILHGHKIPSEIREKMTGGRKEPEKQEEKTPVVWQPHVIFDGVDDAMEVSKVLNDQKGSVTLFIEGGKVRGITTSDLSSDTPTPPVDSAAPEDGAECSANARQVGGNHYRTSGAQGGDKQHWDIVAEHGLDYFQGQITKYVMRWKQKNGVEDLRKAQHFLQKYIELAEGNGNYEI